MKNVILPDCQRLSLAQSASQPRQRPSMNFLALPSALLSSITPIRHLIMAAAVGLAVWTQLPAQSPRRIDEALRDVLIRLHAQPTPESRILVVDIDESTLVSRPWPWPRTRLAELIERLLEGGARGVALDILLLKPADQAGDARMAMLAAHGPVVLAQMFSYGKDNAYRSGALLNGAPLHAPGALPAAGFLANHAGLGQARHAGNIGVVPDPDGVLRSVPLLTSFANRQYETLSLALLRCCGAAPDKLPATMRVPFRRSWDAYTVANAGEILDGLITPATIAGRQVLIGSSSLSIGDRVATPMDALTPGLLVHAALLSELLDRQAGKAPAPWPGGLLAIAYSILAVAAMAKALPRLPAVANIALLAGISLLWLALAWFIHPHDGAFSVSGPLAVTLFLLAVAVPFHWQLAQHRSRRLLDTLRQYVDTAVVDELLRLGLKDPLRPRQLQVTTLIADMEDYTNQVEALPVDEAARLTSEFLDCLTRPVLAHQGTLDKFTGDGLVAFWGAPVPNQEHADLALDAARDILREVRQMSRRREREGKPRLRVRIGVESGLAMAGDYGTPQRSIYTAVGDSVNTASRLEQAARNFPHDIMIGAGTVALARRHSFVYLGERELRGKKHAVTLYTLQEAT
jgi:adenylate cyclase